MLSEEYSAKVQELVTELLTGFKDQLVQYLDDNNRNATGKSKASIQVTNVSPNGGQVIGGKWITWVFTGRGPGGFPPLSAIIDWLNARGLPRGMAWNVAKKIAEEGTRLFKQGGKNNNAITEILTEDVINDFSKNIADLLAIEIKSGIMEVFA